MKICLVLLAVLGSTIAAPYMTIHQELMDFLTALPIDKIKDVHFDHLKTDPGYKAALKYFQSTEWRTMHKALKSRQSVKTILKIVKEAGLDCEVWEKIAWNYIAGLNIDVADDERRSMGSVISEVDSLIPYEKLMDMFADKLDNSPVFRKFYDAISSDTVYNLMEKMMVSSEHKKMYHELLSMDVPMDDIKDAIYVIMGWKSSTSMINDLPE
ncbi:PREDICTED: uncharacterized protein LOC108566098 [Nicrophorus vespilloides]|uniref:Uncharacterized protein LOC108566098 n=1 Tax=Nicrophorus vespilloides TaxID=110193 RepID=A0ABM1N3A9_NICVS|nr:PREDICTED: uncharacterized protein LOC108566098 [Nicrophorus vespilloides]